MNQVYSTKDRTTLIIANPDAIEALVFKQNREQKTVEVYSATGSQKRNPPESDRSTPPIVYYERMRRIDMTPWFLYATCASLNVAMTKAGELVNLIGKDNVMNVKGVSLDQYIEIV